MLGVDAFHITDGGQVDLLIPRQQLTFIGHQRNHLPAGEVDSKQLPGILDKFFHWRDYKPKGLATLSSHQTLFTPEKFIPWQARPASEPCCA
jgi:hypothetical protein